MIKCASSFNSDPSAWSKLDVTKWVIWAMHQYNIPNSGSCPVEQWASNMDGQTFAQMTEQDFRARMPQVRKTKGFSKEKEI